VGHLQPAVGSKGPTTPVFVLFSDCGGQTGKPPVQLLVPGRRSAKGIAAYSGANVGRRRPRQTRFIHSIEFIH